METLNENDGLMSRRLVVIQAPMAAVATVVGIGWLGARIRGEVEPQERVTPPTFTCHALGCDPVPEYIEVDARSTPVVCLSCPRFLAGEL